MTDTTTQGDDYCSALVKARDEDRWLAARYAALKDRRRLLALHAFQCELRRIPSTTSEAPLGEIRLQWWREALQEIRDGKPPRAHPVTEEIAAAGLAAAEFGPLIDSAVSAGARMLYGRDFADAADLAAWLEKTDGAFDAVAVRLLGGDAALAGHAARAGSAFALAREGRVLAPSLVEEVRHCALSLAAEATPHLQAAPAEIAPAILHFALTEPYMRRGSTPFPFAKRARLFSAMAFKRF